MFLSNKMNLTKKIDKIWEDNKFIFENKLNIWLESFENNRETLVFLRSKFHQWGNLRIYISTTKAKLCIFSLRFFGQEVAQLILKDGKIAIRLSGHSVSNKKYFKGFKLNDADYFWHSAEGKEFRSFFKRLAASCSYRPGVRILEHRVESKFIVEMLKGSDKFGIKGLKIRPVTVSGIPLQIPVPISASAKEPKSGNGYIDILSRYKGKDNKDRLCMWELKRPGIYGHPASQVYIYAATLLKIFRYTKNGAKWYQFFGFKRQLPKSIEIEAVVAISSDQGNKFRKEFAELQKNSSFQIGKDRINLYVAYYTEEKNSTRIIFESNPFTGNQ